MADSEKVSSLPSQQALTFGAWFQVRYLAEFGPVDPKDRASVQKHRHLKNWCESAWLHGRASMLDESEGV